MLKKGTWGLLLALSIGYSHSYSTFAAESKPKKYSKKTVVNFEDAVVEGKAKKPSGAYILNGTEMDFQTLHIIKDKMNKKIIESKEYLEDLE